ncbi:ChbG/HpnK family deacetylase [Pelagicoccus sp. NFK12]|uniref:ChbG/HpnK family deacetylase n=1 Tax=Pelagicoccus enzymogenes TaxID=2773457 RepID=A0A927F518_9BACT|nr:MULTISPECIES: ChbG/HpnK family deacetylase [Pelagicoccus]MBD5778508.1 ChbG/HpnK family deacetylase [Pelagicoccus enzymogenes]MDQ8181413.1 ChbG/HpnK family deacetylase [Pelagicoccus sp. SDUM812005]
MTAEIQLLVRADDIGSSHAANLACVKALRDGIARSVEIMAPCSWFPEAVSLLKDLPAGRDVGVHLTLTSEWPNVKWRPLTHCPSLTDELGYFLPRIWPRFDGDLCLRNRPWKRDEVEAEFRAQIELCQAQLPELNHLSYHMGCNDADPRIGTLCRELAVEYELAADPFAAGFKSIPLAPKSEIANTTERLHQALSCLQPGKWILIDHPSLDNEEMQGICNVNGRKIARERQHFTDACCSPSLLELIRHRNIQLVSYAARG